MQFRKWFCIWLFTVVLLVIQNNSAFLHMENKRTHDV